MAADAPRVHRPHVRPSAGSDRVSVAADQRPPAKKVRSKAELDAGGVLPPRKNFSAISSIPREDPAAFCRPAVPSEEK